MNLEQFIAALDRANLDFQINDVLDALWLAGLDRTLTGSSLALASHSSDKTTGRPPSVTSSENGALVSAPADRRELDDRPDNQATKKQSTPVFPLGDPLETGRSVKASPAMVPLGRALPNRLSLMRSLRPLRQRWPSRQALELDEERTVEATAELRNARSNAIYPKFLAQSERWFDVDVVCEDDAAIELWDDVLRDFSQMLRDTGAFRQVRLWRLRLRNVAVGGSLSVDVLETPAQNWVRSDSLAGSGVRRLVFFASHGASRNWRNGEYGRVLGPWLHDCSVVLLHLMPYERWEFTRLGEPQGVCAADQPGSNAAVLKVEPFRFVASYDARSSALLPLPVVPLDSHAMSRWAFMLMGRGRRCPVFLIDTRAGSVAHEPAGGELERASARDVELSVAYLRETSPEAFRLAVNLCSAPFTVSVARLIQHTMFGEAADQSHLAELFLSGLVAAKGVKDGDGVTNARYFEIRPVARRVLLRSLRDSDAQRLATALRKQVSAYIEAITGSPISFAALVPDDSGKYDLPTWAQPFAEMAVALRGQTPGPVDGERVRELVRRFEREYPPEIVGAAARLAADAERRWPGSASQRVIDALVQAQLIQPTPGDAWSSEPGVVAGLVEIEQKKPLLGVCILWVDDVISNDLEPPRRMRALGAEVRTVSGSQEAITSIRSHRFDIVISEMSSGTTLGATTAVMGLIKRSGLDLPVVIYTTGVDPSHGDPKEAFYEGTFGRARNFDELFTLVKHAARREGAVVPPVRVANSLSLLKDGNLATSFGEMIRLRNRKSEEIGSLRLRSNVNALCTLLDGRLAAGCQDGAISVWDLTRGLEDFRLEGSGSPVLALCVLADGRLAAGRDNGSIDLWDVRTGVLSRQVKTYRGPVTVLLGLPYGRLASVSNDENIALWSVSSGEATGLLKGHTATVLALCMLPDGTLASASRDKTIRVWGVLEAEEVKRFEASEHAVSALTVMPDGNLVSGDQDGVVTVWSRDSFRPFKIGKAVDSLAALPSGQLFAVDHFGDVHLVPIEGSIGEPEGETVEDTSSFSPARQKRLERTLSHAGVLDAEALVRDLQADNIARAVLSTGGTHAAAFRQFVDCIVALTECIVAQVMQTRNDGKLEVVADYFAPSIGPGDKLVEPSGMIGQAIRTRQHLWVPDTEMDFAGRPTFVRTAAITRSALVLPIFDQRGSSAGIVNIEFQQRDALSIAQRNWLLAFVAPLSNMIPTGYQRLVKGLQRVDPDGENETIVADASAATQIQRNGSKYSCSIHIEARGRVWIVRLEAGDVTLRKEVVPGRSLQQLDPGFMKRSLEEIIQFGELLFNVVFTEEIRDVFRRVLKSAGERSRTALARIVVDGDLAQVPWEAIYDPEWNIFLCLEVDIVRLVSPARAVPTAPQPRDGPIRILAIIANSPSHAGLLDINQMRFELSHLSDIGMAHVNFVASGDLNDLRRAVKTTPQWDVVHLVGEVRIRRYRDQPILIFGDRDPSPNFSSDALGAALGGVGSPRVAVLKPISIDPDLPIALSSTASVLIRNGVSTVVTVQGRDSSSGQFDQEFYRDLANGGTIETAIRAARRYLHQVDKSVDLIASILYSSSI